MVDGGKARTDKRTQGCMDKGKGWRDTRTAGWTEVRIGLTRLQSVHVQSRTNMRTLGWTEVRLGLTEGLQGGLRSSATIVWTAVRFRIGT